jgi:DNA-binding transcriptional ArsR family regulator
VTSRSAVNGEADLAAVGALLAEPARARVLLALADGRSLPATVLAAEAGVSASTASHHLHRLLDARLIAVTTRGRHRYYRLSGPEVGQLIEAVARVAPVQPVTSLRQGTRAHAVRYARHCYDHLAGRLGVALTDAMLASGLLAGDNTVDLTSTPQGRPVGRVSRTDGLELTADGRVALTALGVDVPVSSSVRCCLDWTEQRHHLSGAHGRAILSRLLDLGWVVRSQRSRALRVSGDGATGLCETFGVELPED